MKTSTDTLAEQLRIIGQLETPHQHDVLMEAADRLEQLTAPDDATFARIVDAINNSINDEPYRLGERALRNAYRAAVRVVES
jgi:hypothetical protein